jgi:uncharacterized membrane protein YeiH
LDNTAISIITATRVPAMPKVAKPAASIIKKSFCGMAKILAVINIKIALKSDAIKNTGFCMFTVRLLAIYFNINLPKFRFK